MCYVYLVHKPYSYGDLPINVLLILLQDTPAEVHVMLLYFDLQEIRLFIMFYL